ncbi:unnamed protein product [Closterium sp. Naga37s-1]|nr:unnamed protein product [Closterium sp. Naga37s-1]
MPHCLRPSCPTACAPHAPLPAPLMPHCLRRSCRTAGAWAGLFAVFIFTKPLPRTRLPPPPPPPPPTPSAVAAGEVAGGGRGPGEVRAAHVCAAISATPLDEPTSLRPSLPMVPVPPAPPHAATTPAPPPSACAHAVDAVVSSTRARTSPSPPPTLPAAHSHRHAGSGGAVGMARTHGGPPCPAAALPHMCGAVRVEVSAGPPVLPHMEVSAGPPVLPVAQEGRAEASPRGEVRGSAGAGRGERGEREAKAVGRGARGVWDLVDLDASHGDLDPSPSPWALAPLPPVPPLSPPPLSAPPFHPPASCLPPTRGNVGVGGERQAWGAVPMQRGQWGAREDREQRGGRGQREERGERGKEGEREERGERGDRMQEEVMVERRGTAEKAQQHSGAMGSKSGMDEEVQSFHVLALHPCATEPHHSAERQSESHTGWLEMHSHSHAQRPQQQQQQQQQQQRQGDVHVCADAAVQSRWVRMASPPRVPQGALPAPLPLPRTGSAGCTQGGAGEGGHGREGGDGGEGGEGEEGGGAVRWRAQGKRERSRRKARGVAMDDILRRTPILAARGLVRPEGCRGAHAMSARDGGEGRAGDGMGVREGWVPGEAGRGGDEVVEGRAGTRRGEVDEWEEWHRRQMAAGGHAGHAGRAGQAVLSSAQPARHDGSSAAAAVVERVGEAHAGGEAGMHAGGEAGMHAGGEAGMHAGGEAGMHAGGEAGMHAGGEAGMHAGGEAGMHAGGEAGMHAGGEAGMHAAAQDSETALWALGVVGAAGGGGGGVPAVPHDGSSSEVHAGGAVEQEPLITYSLKRHRKSLNKEHTWK